MSVAGSFRGLVADTNRSTQLQAEIREGIANLSSLVSESNRVVEVREAVAGLAVDVREGIAGVAGLAVDVRQGFEGVAGLTDLTAENTRALGSALDRVVQVQAEVRAGVENLAALIDQRTREQIAQQENSSKRLERLLEELAAATARQAEATAGVAWAIRASGQAREVETVERVEIAPVQGLPMPQVSLRRPNPVSDLMATKEYRAYVDFFGSNATVRRSLLTPEAHAVVYAFVRKLRPGSAAVVASDGAAVAETVARAMHASGGGRLDVFDPVGGARAIVDQWPAELGPLVNLAGAVFSPPDDARFVYVDARAPQLGQWLDEAVAPVNRGAILTVGGIPDQMTGTQVRDFFNSRGWTPWSVPNGRGVSEVVVGAAAAPQT